MESMRSHSPQRRAEARLDIAVQVAESLGQYGWVTLPQRPLTVEAPDEDLIRWHQARQAGQQMKRDESRQLKQLYRWWSAVTTKECQTAGRLTTLIWAAEALHGAPVPTRAAAMFDLVAAFIAEEYGVSLPPFPEQWEREMLVQRQCRDMELLPASLRLMQQARKRKEPEPDAGPAQQEAF